MKPNVIILTHGLSGSSVFAGLIAREGYWLGDSTFEKSDYNTHENIELIELNEKMLKELGYEGNYEYEFNLKLIDRFAAAADQLDLAPYKRFVERCESMKPWIWKDPRLTWTIRIWARFLPMQDIKFVVLTRDDEQAWISSNLRRHIQSRKFTYEYNLGITNSIKDFLNDQNKEFLSFKFEDLLLQPEKTIQQLNQFLSIALTMDDVKAVYRYDLYKKSNGVKEKLIALAIYLKNYRLRDARGSRDQLC